MPPEERCSGLLRCADKRQLKQVQAYLVRVVPYTVFYRASPPLPEVLRRGGARKGLEFAGINLGYLHLTGRYSVVIGPSPLRFNRATPRPPLVLAGMDLTLDRSADFNSMWSSLELTGPRFSSVNLYFTSMSSISKMSVEPPGILGGEPRSPYAI